MRTREEKIAFILSQSGAAGEQPESAPMSREEKIAFIQQAQASAPEKKESGPSIKETAIRQAGAGFTANFDDEIGGGISALGRLAGVENLGSWKPFDENSHLEFSSPTIDTEKLKEAYVKNRDALRADQAADLATNPKTAVAAQIAGTIANPILRKAGTGGKLSGRILGSAGVGGLIGAGDSKADLTKGEIGEFAKDTAKGTALGVGGGALAEGLAAAAPTVAKVAKPIVDKAADTFSNASKYIGKKALSVFFGPNSEAIETYLKKADGVRNAQSVEEIKNGIDNAMQGLFDDVEKSKLSRDQAQVALDAIESKIKDTISESRFNFRIRSADIKDQLRDAQSKLESAFQAEKDKLASVKSPLGLSDDVGESIQQLKERIKQGSEESYQILDKDTRAYSVRGGGKILRAMADEMNIQPFDQKGLVQAGRVPKLNASAPVTSQSQGVQNELRAFANRLENTPELVPARELKKILQQIDNSEKAMYGQPGFDSRVSQAYKMVRATIDKAIKEQNPAYREVMERVAGDTKLMDQAIKRFGDSRTAASRLNNITSETSLQDRELMKRIGQSTSKNFDEPIEQYSKAQATLKDPKAMESIRRGLPEYKNVRLQEFANRQAQRPESIVKYVDEDITIKGLRKQKADIEKQLADREAALISAQETLEPYKTLTPANTQSKVKALLNAPGKENIEIRRTLENLSKLTQKDFIGQIAARRAANQFQGEFRLGSRNVNLWTLVGAFGGGGVGAGAGAVLGATVDRYGPKIAQKMLDAVLKIEGAPTIQKIKGLNLSPDVEFALMKELGRSGLQSAPRGANLYNTATNEPTKGPEKWANDGFNKILNSSDEVTRARYEQLKTKLMKDPKAKRLLMSASDLNPDSKAFKNLMKQLEERAIDRTIQGGE